MMAGEQDGCTTPPNCIMTMPMRLKIYWDESRVWIQGIDIRCTVLRRTARSSMKAPDSSCLKEKNINVHDSSDALTP